MSIRRAPRPESNFYLLDKRISEDKRLSWGARGMLIFLLGKPDHWEVSVANLINETAGSAKKSGRDAVYGMLKELESAGYLSRDKARSKGGEFGGVDYIVHESPLTEKPDTVKPYTDEPDTVNPTQVSTEGLVSNEVEASTDVSSPKTAKKPKAARKVAMPTDFVPNETNQRLAKESGVDLAIEAAKFQDYHGSKGSRFVDWNLALNTWLRNAGKWAKPSNVHAFPGKPRPVHTQLDQASDNGLRQRADGAYSL